MVRGLTLLQSKQVSGYLLEISQRGNARNAFELAKEACVDIQTAKIYARNSSAIKYQMVKNAEKATNELVNMALRLMTPQSVRYNAGLI